MPVEQLTYAQIAERLGVSAEAARAIVFCVPAK
jgi:DNA-directed RNA polymerase specialized sigma24 family protein